MPLILQLRKNVKVIPFPEIKNSYIVISCEQDHCTGNGVRETMSFLYATESCGAEWEPNHGPIVILTPCGSEDPLAQPHFFWPHFTGADSWSQPLVNKECLPEKFLDGNYVGIFEVLKRWSGDV